MKKFSKKLIPLSVVLALLFAGAGSAWAANDVTITADTDVYLSGSGETVTIVAGSIMNSFIAASSTTSQMKVITEANSSVTLRSTSRTLLGNDGGTGSEINTTCYTDYSEITFGNVGTITITPSGSCPSPSGGGGGAAPAPTPAPEEEAAAVTASGEASVAPAAGGTATATTDEGAEASVTVPANAVSATTNFKVDPKDTATETADKPAPTGKSLVGNYVYDYSATADGAEVASFDEEVTVTLKYTDAQVANYDENGLQIYYWDGNEWVVVITTLDAANNTLTGTVSHFTLFTIMGVVPVEEEEVSLVDVDGNALADGDLITTADSFDIYIVKLIGDSDKKFKRLILNPDIFDSYGHFDWGDVKTVSQAVQDAFAESQLVQERNDDGTLADEKVYKLTSEADADVGVKHWVNMTAAEFEAAGYDWDAIYWINHVEAGEDFYPLGDDVTA